MSNSQGGMDTLYKEQETNFEHWELIKDCIDQFIDMMLNYRQSGHPGGSRSKVHALVTATLSGAMRWDIRRPELRFADRFVLVAGHCAPLVYAMLPLYNEALREMFKRTGDDKYLVPNTEHRMLVWEDLLTFRRNQGLAGHAEMEGKTLFFKFNTGPSGHGSPSAALVFVRCEFGLSHNEAEYATPEDVEAGANVLLHAVLELDGRSSQGGLNG